MRPRPPYRRVRGLAADMAADARLDVVSTGQGNTRVLLLHGSGSGARPLLRLGEHLVEAIPDSEAHAVSLAGYGSTAAVALPIIDQHLAVIAEVMAAQTWHLVGHSMGGFLALQAALAIPEQVASLTLIEPIALGVLDPVTDQDAIAADRAVIESFAASSDEERGIACFIEAWNQSEWESLPPSLREQLKAMAPQIYAEAVAVSADATELAAYQQLPQPMLLCCGGQSPLPARRAAERLASLPTVVERLWLEEAGHMSVLREPERFAPAIAAHIIAASRTGS